MIAIRTEGEAVMAGLRAQFAAGATGATAMTKQTDEIAALKARVEELERAAKPPEPKKPFVPQPYQQYDPTAGMCMPPSALAAMVAAVPDHVIREIAMRDNRAPRTPATIPSSHTGGGGLANVPGSGTGWAHETPIGPPPGINWVDAQLIADDVKQRSKGKP
jgi:hypothetical protein